MDSILQRERSRFGQPQSALFLQVTPQTFCQSPVPSTQSSVTPRPSANDGIVDLVDLLVVLLAELYGILQAILIVPLTIYLILVRATLVLEVTNPQLLAPHMMAMGVARHASVLGALC